MKTCLIKNHDCQFELKIRVVGVEVIIDYVDIQAIEV